MSPTDRQNEPDYEVGYKRPPKSTRFQPGQRANPKGRPRHSPNARAVVERALYKKIPVRRGDKTSTVPTLQAIAEVNALKAAQGDRHAAGIVLNLANKTGILNAPNENAPDVGNAPPITMRNGRPSEALIESIDPNLLSRQEQIELSNLAERLDDAGDVMALNVDDLLRLRQLVSTGRGQGVTPRADAGLRKAA